MCHAIQRGFNHAFVQMHSIHPRSRIHAHCSNPIAHSNVYRGTNDCTQYTPNMRSKACMSLSVDSRQHVAISGRETPPRWHKYFLSFCAMLALCTFAVNLSRILTHESNGDLRSSANMTGTFVFLEVETMDAAFSCRP